MIAVLSLALILVASTADAAELHGRVVSITDGDTIVVLDDRHRQHKVRLSGIDAPERHQPWGARSRQALGRLVHRKSVTVDWYKRDRWGRIVGSVWRGGKDVGLTMVRSGMAWWFRRYADEQSPADRASYAAAEDEARTARRGLWQDPRPLPPWVWRRR
ncbi:thermonuclease family protein [Kaustia mangrovi]|uniref:Thermonuclease family protein n=1 Tax=Kaustia mangrovi TaxID=2593653 RepID=A0A7S8C5X2_9HYPH|nr:thermonuclease family protein [Kaustia mangrovi]QPC43990.1 thermonuclease family protein [Kaustia mangrovi]